MLGMLFIILFACGVWVVASKIDKNYRDKKIVEKKDTKLMIKLKVSTF